MYVEVGVFFFLFITGLCIGSFLNVVIYRIPLSLIKPQDDIFNIAWPPSHCTNCKNKILKRDNIPVFSWLLLKGQCRFCGSVISSRYPIIELITGLCFSVTGLWMFDSLNQQPLLVISVLFLFSVLLCLTVIDLDHLLLPDSLVFTLLWTGLLAATFEVSPVHLKDAVIGVCGTWLFLSVITYLFTVIRNKEGLGGGDVKLISALSAWVGWYYIPALLVFSSVIGFILFFIAKRKMEFSSDTERTLYYVVPFGPAISLTAFFIYLSSINKVNFIDGVYEYFLLFL
ncbi:prepilin peptidase [Escherichia coli]|uniref:prepilin peptidase n=1 Tax=Escherichia coli TaxID=562 RepID=UPI000B7F69EF|nr:A24 family peptidase [Escherichia coli]